MKHITLKERIEQILKEDQNDRRLLMVRSIDKTSSGLRYALDINSGRFNYEPFENWIVTDASYDYDEDEMIEYINIDIKHK